MPGQIAEAFVRIRPDFAAFKTELAAGLGTAVSGASLAGAAAATTELSTAQLALFEATDLSSAQMTLFNVAASEEAAVAKIASGATTQLAASQAALAKSTQASTAALFGLGTATGRLDAALLGLRTAVGSSAVIGLGAGALAAIAFGKALRSSLQLTAEFETQLNVLAATADATDDQLQAVSRAALELGADVTLPAVSAADAAEAMTALVKAGLSVDEAISGARGVLQLATAAQISNAEASELAANALNAFGLEGREAVRVADALANAANAAQGSISDFGAALSQSAAVARQVGLNLEDTTAILSLLAQNGLRGSDAGTSLRTALLRLVSPTQRASELMSTLNLNIRDVQGNVRPEVFAEFGEATAALGPEIRDAAAALIFGQDAIRAVAVAAREGRDGLREMQFRIDQQGTAAEIARARTDGLGGAMSGLSSNLETAGIALGKFISPGLTSFVQLLSASVGAVNTFVGSLTDLRAALIDAGRAANESGFGQFFEDLSARAQGLVNPIQELRRSLLGDIAGGSDEASASVAELTKQLDFLQTARVQAQQGGFSKAADDLTVQINDLRAEINSLGGDAASLIPLTATERDIAQLEDSLKALGQARQEALIGDPGADVSAIDATMISIANRVSELSRGIANDVEQGTRGAFAQLKKGLETALQLFEADPTGPIAEKSLTAIRRLIRRIQEEGGSLSGAAGKEIGKRLMDAMGTSITTEEASVIASARQALRNAIRAADDQVQAAVTSARDNLQSLGDDLSTQLEQIIDVGPIGRRIAELNKELDDLQARSSRRSLRFDVSQANVQLREAREAVAQIGELSPQQQRARREFLAPFIEGAKEAKDKVKEFTLEEAIQQQEDLKDAAIKTAQEGIDRIIDAFEDGKISADQFNKRLSNLISGPLDILKTKFGKNLGIQFTDEFFANVRNLRDQVKELVGFLNIKPDSGVVPVGERAAEAQQGVTAARISLNEAIQKATENTSENSDDMVSLLEDILDALGGKGGGTRKGGKVRTKGPGRPD